MRSIAIVIASLAAMLALTACNGERYSAAFGPEPTAAPIPTPYVIVVKEPAPADTGVNGFVVAGLIIIGLGLGMGVSALIVAIAFARSRSTPERSQLNERPTYVAPPRELPDAPALQIVFPPGYDWIDKMEYLRARGLSGAQAKAALEAMEPPRALPPPRR